VEQEHVMNKDVKETFSHLGSTDDKIRMQALQTILALTEVKVDWACEVWEDLLARLNHENSYQRSIAIMLLCNLAKSDRENRLGGSLNQLLAHTKDEKFITSRQCIQNLWKAAAADQANRGKVLKHLEKRFKECAGEKHANLLRQDIIQSIKSLYVMDKDEALIDMAQSLIAGEEDEKNRKKYEAVLKAK
jgi:hypothetical protein